MQIACFESLGEQDRDWFAEAAAEYGLALALRAGPLGDEEALLVEHRDVPFDELAAMRQLRAVYALEYGRATLSPAQLAARGVELRLVPDLGGLGVAEHVFALLLALKKQLLRGHQRVAASHWREGVAGPVLTEQRHYTFNWAGLDGIGWLYDETIGIIGFGRIGQAVATRARAFGMRVLYHNPRRLTPAREAALGVRFASLPDLLARADAITLHIPHSAANEHLIGATGFAAMKRSALLINTARGRVIDEAALIAALRDGSIAGAGLDVLAHEPPERDHPLLGLENVILSPHVAGIYSPIARRAQFRLVCRWASEG